MVISDQEWTMRTERKIAASEASAVEFRCPVTIIGRPMSLMNRHETGTRRNRKFPNEPTDSGE